MLVLGLSMVVAGLVTTVGLLRWASLQDAADGLTATAVVEKAHRRTSFSSASEDVSFTTAEGQVVTRNVLVDVSHRPGDTVQVRVSADHSRVVEIGQTGPIAYIRLAAIVPAAMFVFGLVVVGAYVARRKHPPET